MKLVPDEVRWHKANFKIIKAFDSMSFKTMNNETRKVLLVDKRFH